MSTFADERSLPAVTGQSKLTKEHWKRLASCEEAEDVQGEIFTTILENSCMQFWSEEAQQRWMWRVARNKVIDVYRTLECVPLEEICDELYENERYRPEQTALRHEAAMYLDEAVRALPPLQQRLLRWRFVYEMRYIDMAGQLGKSEEAVRTQIFRTLKVLLYIRSKVFIDGHMVSSLWLSDVT
ncbi:RNA polymerase sigma factor [Ktedonospora formicarum]|uniref:RNA polymerase sigma factor 70 region 4 type 2 domain-containing protein n=1 Tax=Ktedonospora formicarum TaxID=2778364 RepID=A0A8J3IBW9_9CHLR|nr:sigma-70 family RNA polymerase sigma factor [Ktedonospora formicarum]GHO49249.1 hypothetical protein KSX_74120 [Ktedonospora formicarum]